MTVFYNHYNWFLFMFFICLVFFCLSLYISFMNESIFIAIKVFFLWNFDLEVSFYFDYFSGWFSFIISMISMIIMIYSFFYMGSYSKSIYFLWLTFLFVFSMLMVVNMANIFFIMLGWDGLGIISFFLIVFYQNQSSIISGIFTFMMNRLGDGFFLASIVLMIVFYYDYTFVLGGSIFVGLLCLLVLAFMTKSALYPFSSWLPLAMAAPTPISALVHSSTLVAAGLFLMMRFSFFLYSFSMLMIIMMIISIFTSFYAGMNSIFELDMKKLIALSTLSHLGFIGLSFAMGLLSLSFFHMLVHALFKSLLFMAMGDIMVSLSHSQDIRYLSMGNCFTPFSFSIMFVSLMGLLGMPNMSGFFSKDLILEVLGYSYVSWSFIVIMFMNVFFTYFYTLKLFYYSFQSSKVESMLMISSDKMIHSILLLFLGLLSVFFGWFFMLYICKWIIFIPIIIFFKFLPFFLMLSMVFLLFLFYRNMFLVKNVFLVSYYSSMMFLTDLLFLVSSKFYFSSVFISVKVFENGIMNSMINSMMFYFSSFLFKKVMSIMKMQYFILFTFLLLCYIIILMY